MADVDLGGQTGGVLPVPLRQALTGWSYAAAAAAHWLTADLVRTESARARLQAWCDAGMPRSDGQAIPLLGDARALVRGVVSRIVAPPVRWWLEQHTLIVAVGRRMAGFYTPADFAAMGRRSQVIAVATNDRDVEVESVVAHEIAHAWLSPIIAPGVGADHVRFALGNADAFGERDAGHCLPDSLVHVVLADEAMAAGLAQSWGFVGAAADPAAVVALTRRRLMAKRTQDANQDTEDHDRTPSRRARARRRPPGRRGRPGRAAGPTAGARH